MGRYRQAFRRARRLSAAVALGAVLGACATTAVRTSLPVTWWPSPNFSERRPDYIVLHHTGSSSVTTALATLTNPDKAVSAHYLIAPDGKIYQLVDEAARAWHAGDSRWGSLTDLNSTSIGIELVNDGSTAFPPEQITALLALIADICRRDHIPPSHVVGHADIAPARKLDPSALFPWDVLAAAGFGLWCDPPYPEAPAEFDVLRGLQAIGYDVSDPDAALRAFRLHYNPGAVAGAPSGRERALVQCLAGRL
jgi:N-acetylmuramoyl-L-alanine amidase